MDELKDIVDDGTEIRYIDGIVKAKAPLFKFDIEPPLDPAADNTCIGCE